MYDKPLTRGKGHTLFLSLHHRSLRDPQIYYYCAHAERLWALSNALLNTSAITIILYNKITLSPKYSI
jgi:hypothetical protein